MENENNAENNTGRGAYRALAVILGALIVFTTAIVLNRREVVREMLSDETWSSVITRSPSADEHVFGDVNAPVRLILYTDLECPFCKRQFEEHVPLYKTKYGDNIAFVMRHFPNTRIHPTARQAAEAWECAAHVGGEASFWQFASDFYAASDGPVVPKPEDYSSIAAGLGIDVAAFNRCVSERLTTDVVAKDLLDGSLAGITVTPSEVIERDGRKVLISGSSRARVDATVRLLLQERELLRAGE
jgi:protein-disulfide isomerase